MMSYSSGACPIRGKKVLLFLLTIVWTGFVFLVTSMMAGGGLAAGLTFNELLLAMILGNLFLCIIAGLVSVIAYKTGLTFALLTRYSLGQEGSRVASLFVPIDQIFGWYPIQAALYGHFIAQVFNLSYTGEIIAMMLSAVIMGIFAVLGIKSLAVFGWLYCDSIHRIPFPRNGGSLGSNNRWLARVI